ncbi:RidA family protein [Solilutibacter tolerans]|uniref:Enamine deaminase RidA, house cleaning of reactive enamine intermediates, YjgF/YER057c/UK114 family n=1 Tax=Solilutibacter tolerans TaxID=1604334 RepID=A0A1N6YR03_9GAMM|nr:RidA family protein [Lysobacter tolerans]SIR16869.1 Enamine deaminase RidA, house cleaning of reactive enamine intermediates, YjgF/YER057c/UK114 family [Lysobacter tolerans]
MSVELLNPDGIFKPDSYFQVGVGTGSRVVFLSGQVAQDQDGNLVGKGDLAAQAEQVYLNVAAALKGAGATFSDVVKLTVYVTDWAPEKMEQLIAGAMRAAGKLGFDPRRAITLIGVASLSSPDLLIEVEAVAIVS